MDGQSTSAPLPRAKEGVPERSTKRIHDVSHKTAVLCKCVWSTSQGHKGRGKRRGGGLQVVRERGEVIGRWTGGPGAGRQRNDDRGEMEVGIV
jgi:hypothetical protein